MESAADRRQGAPDQRSVYKQDPRLERGNSEQARRSTLHYRPRRASPLNATSNGARGALLRALVDTPAVADCVGCLASNVVNVVNVVDVRWRKCIGVRQPGSGATRRICSCTPRSSQFCSRSQAKEAHRGQPSGGLLLSSSFFIANIIW